MSAIIRSLKIRHANRTGRPVTIGKHGIYYPRGAK